MNYADFNTQPNGFPLESDATLGFMQADYQNSINGLAGLAGGNKVIVSGCIDSGVSVSPGWVIINGELMKFAGGTKQANVVVTETVVQKANDGGVLVDRYFTRMLTFGSGTGSFPYSDLISIDTVKGLSEKLTSLFGLENEVIIKGCVVSGVTISNVNISAGIVIINNKFLEPAAYSGGYPIYLNEFGQWVNSQPASNFIKFDPYTSQRVGSVFKRATTVLGEILMMAVLSDRFDNTGLGKWEFKGFAIANGANGTIDVRGRFPIAYDNRLTDPGNGVWDADYNTPGNNGGYKSVTLVEANLPEHTHTVNQGNSYTGNGGAGTVGRGAVNPNTFETEPAGSNTPHENRPPYKVFVFIQRIA